jgi:hypothetical protein
LFGDFTIGSVCLEKQKRREKAEEEEIEYGKRVFGLVSLRRRRFGAEKQCIGSVGSGML